MISFGQRSAARAGIIQRVKKILGRNIATVLFTIIFLYMVISILFYLNSSHIVSYQVVQGPLSRNDTYTGLALREE